MEKPHITEEQVITEYEAKYIKVFDMQYAPGKHYYNATRRSKDNLVVLKSDEEYKKMVPDAVSCVVIVEEEGKEPKLLLSWEFRYPTGHMILGVPAGLIDAKDKETASPVKNAAVREIREETGIEITEDEIEMVNPLLFSTPGMTDESNAIVCVRISPEALKTYTREGAESSEIFEGMELLSRAEVRKMLEDGRDPVGNFYSVYTWIALVWFLLKEQ